MKRSEIQVGKEYACGPPQHGRARYIPCRVLVTSKDTIGELWTRDPVSAPVLVRSQDDRGAGHRDAATESEGLQIQAAHAAARSSMILHEWSVQEEIEKRDSDRRNAETAERDQAVEAADAAINVITKGMPKELRSRIIKHHLLVPPWVEVRMPLQVTIAIAHALEAGR